MINLGEFKLRNTNESEMFYIATLDTDIIVTNNAEDLDMYDTVGKIKVYHDGLYFGTVEEMYEWIEESVIDHLIEKGNIVKTGETVMGEPLWELRA